MSDSPDDHLPDEPDARLWSHALRTQLDAVVVGFEAQLRQHVAVAARAARGEADALRAETLRLRAEVDVAKAALARSEETVRSLEARLSELGQQIQTLDEQFADEKRWVSAALACIGTPLFEALQQALSVPIEATPACHTAIKSRKADAVLAQALRERGRSAVRNPLTEAESAGLRTVAEASQCELVEPAIGSRFSVSAMDKVGTRVEPSEEDMVLECVTPGLRMAGTLGSLVHPRVVVGTV